MSFCAPRLQSRTSLSFTTFHPLIFAPTCRWKFTCVLGSFPITESSFTQSTFCNTYPIHKIWFGKGEKSVFSKVRAWSFPSGNVFKYNFHRHINNTIDALLLICLRQFLQCVVALFVCLHCEFLQRKSLLLVDNFVTAPSVSFRFWHMVDGSWVNVDYSNSVSCLVYNSNGPAFLPERGPGELPGNDS